MLLKPILQIIEHVETMEFVKEYSLTLEDMVIFLVSRFESIIPNTFLNFRLFTKTRLIALRRFTLKP